MPQPLRYVLGPRVGPFWRDPPPLAAPAASTHGGKRDRTASAVAADLASGSPTVTLEFEDDGGGAESNEPSECLAFFLPAQAPPPADAAELIGSQHPFARLAGPFPADGFAVMTLPPGPMPSHYVVQTCFGFPE